MYLSYYMLPAALSQKQESTTIKIMCFIILLCCGEEGKEGEGGKPARSTHRPRRNGQNHNHKAV